jgi:PAS domain-containing protein
MNDADTSLDVNDSRSQREQADEVEVQPARSVQIEEALRESEERYRRMFENHHAVMLVYDPETFNIIEANPAACHYYSYSHAQLLALDHRPQQHVIGASGP